MRSRSRARGRAALALAGLALLTACGSGASDSDRPGSESATPSATSATGDNAVDVDRDTMVKAITAAFASDGGSARWDGDTLVLSVDGDADDPMAGFTQCRVLSELLAADDASAVEFPNGRIDCDDVLG